MKRICCFALLLSLVACIVFPINGIAESLPTRVINVVYDDSGSMYTGVDTWCQAKYSMEVFAAMLGDKDIMHVYYMSDYEKDTTASPRLTLRGEEGASINVKKIHDQKTRAGNTPFNSVRKAYTDLSRETANEKWLIILTDGEFEDGRMSQNEVDSFINSKTQDVSVLFLGMGSKAAGITSNPANHIFYVEAKTNNQILKRITEICTRVFNTNKLDINVSTKKISFDIPMGELTVFAQGANVEIKGIIKSDGSEIRAGKVPVEVKYSECDATNYNNEPATDLLGKIAIFKDDFDIGDYTVDVSGAETVEIYYKPNIEVKATLTDRQGNTMSDLSNLEAGDYTISFGFVKAGTNEFVQESKLLGDISYEATVINNGYTHEKRYTDGDTITLEEGALVIDAIASYLSYNTVSTHLSYDVYKDKTCRFSTVKTEEYHVRNQGIENSEWTEIAVQIDGNTPTPEQWEVFELPTVQLSDDNKTARIERIEIEKTSTPGLLRLRPLLPNGVPTDGEYGNRTYRISCSQQVGSETWAGESEGILQMSDGRNWFERNRQLVFKLAVLLLILAVVAGYLPFIKHYLPRSLKKRPYIKCISSELGSDRKYRSGTLEKNLLSTIIPYVSQKGKIKYVPKGVTGCPALDVRAIKHHRMSLMNVKAFAGKDYIAFDGETIKKDVKKFETGAGVTIRVKRGEWTYICNPNQEGK